MKVEDGKTESDQPEDLDCEQLGDKSFCASEGWASAPLR
jgi:hypothetical protein